jgi:hypothetical protein
MFCGTALIPNFTAWTPILTSSFILVFIWALGVECSKGAIARIVTLSGLFEQ